ncbi:MAG: GNAT family N-acetyltransferase [Bacillus sp. (in: firmicutes)]
MTIREARPTDKERAAILIYDAIHDIAEALTGETEREKVLAQLAWFVGEKGNRLSYDNMLVKVTENDEAIGLVITYPGDQASELDGRILTYLSENKPSVHLHIDEEADHGDFYIDTVSINPDFRGKGYGTELLQAAIGKAMEQGYTTVSLNVEEYNDNARRLYERLGFIQKKNRVINGHMYAYMIKSVK